MTQKSRSGQFHRTTAVCCRLVLALPFLFVWAGCDSKARQSSTPPAGLVPVIRTANSSVSTSLGIVLAKHEGKAYVFAYPSTEATVAISETNLKEPSPFMVAVDGEYVPADEFAAKLRYKVSGNGWSNSGGLKGSILTIDANKAPEPTKFGEAMDCNEKDILGVVGVVNQKQKNGAPFSLYQDDLVITTLMKDSDPREFYRFTTKRLTGAQLAGIAYNQTGELMGLVEPVIDKKNDSKINVVNSRHLKMVMSACADHVPGFGENP